MSTAVVFLDIEEAFDTTWHSGLLYTFSEVKFSTSHLTNCFFSDNKFKILVECEFSTPREIAAGFPQESVLAPIQFIRK
jgi:hypothetical protein